MRKGDEIVVWRTNSDEEMDEFIRSGTTTDSEPFLPAIDFSTGDVTF